MIVTAIQDEYMDGDERVFVVKAHTEVATRDLPDVKARADFRRRHDTTTDELERAAMRHVVENQKWAKRVVVYYAPSSRTSGLDVVYEESPMRQTMTVMATVFIRAKKIKYEPRRGRAVVAQVGPDCRPVTKRGLLSRGVMVRWET